MEIDLVARSQRLRAVGHHADTLSLAAVVREGDVGERITDTGPSMPTSLRRNDLPTRATVQRVLAATDALDAAVRTFDWDALAEHADELRRLGPTVLASALDVIAADRQHRPVQGDARRWAALWQRIAGTAAGRSIATDLAQGLAPEAARRYRRSLDRLAEGELDGNLWLIDLRGPAASAPPPGVRFVAALGIMAASRSLQARVHVALNLAPRPLTRPTALRRRLDEAHRDLRRGLLAAAASFHVAWPHGDGVEAAHRLIELVEQRLPAFAAVQGSILRALSREGGLAGSCESLRTVLLDAGATTRDAIAMHAGALRALVDAASRSPLDGDATPELVPTELDVEVHAAPRATAGSLLDVRLDEQVTTEADVHSVRVVRRPRLATHVLLADRNGARARLDVALAHLPRAGLTRGARVRVTGTIVGRDAAGRPILRADRLAPAALAERAWIKRLTGEAAPWFRRWPHDVAIDWSLGLHQDLDDRAGAAELVHAPAMHDPRI